ncbi:MAG: UDP-3-O-(3-hydroxymyristoyl)glucosamine N-acyltransferase [Candidatus Cloacimonetes bacterium]|nr:UDP-3-O-(3-hydroxymyristoyl)glucosamine N-acyltransferase [Candidatus Cloacimonadota bacterium]
MKSFGLQLTPELIVSQLPGELIKRKDAVLDNVAELSEATENSICFYENDNFLEALKSTNAGLVFVKNEFNESLHPNTNFLKVEMPYIYFMMLIKTWLSLDKGEFVPYISPKASISEKATLDSHVIIKENVVIGANVKIGKHSVIEANCVIMDNVSIGADCHIFPNVTIYDDTIVKNRVILHAGVVLGADGFGYIYHEGIQQKVPQVGKVVIDEDVEIGANTCIDRAALGTTYIGKHTKIDNLVQIGHNVQVGQNTMLCSQVGIAGSTKIGDLVYMAGQVGCADHITIGDNVKVGAKSGIAGNVESNKLMFGIPARESGITKRIMASERYLPELVKFYKEAMKKREENAGI